MILSDGQIALFPFDKAESSQYRQWVNREEFARLLGRSLPVTEEQHDLWYRSLVQSSGSVVFAVKTVAESSYLGNVWLHNIHWVNRNAELRILLGADQARGRGYGSSACRLLVQFAFQKLGLRKVYLYVSEVNPRAFRAFEKAGFQEEGRLKDEFFVDGEYVDVKRMAIINNP